MLRGKPLPWRLSCIVQRKTFAWFTISVACTLLTSEAAGFSPPIVHLTLQCVFDVVSSLEMSIGDRDFVRKRNDRVNEMIVDTIGFINGRDRTKTKETRSIWKMLGPFATASRLTPIHQVSLAVLSRAACASMSTTSTTTTTTRDRGDRYAPMEWAQLGERRLTKDNTISLQNHNQCQLYELKVSGS